MQVMIHNVDEAMVTDFTDYDHPFVGVTFRDGKSSEIKFLLSDKKDLHAMQRAVSEALALMEG